MPIKWIRLSFLALPIGALVALTACAATNERAASDFSPARDCMFAATLRDWRPLDDENLVLFGSGHVPYHVELVRPAFGLNFNFMIGVYDRDGRICPYGGDAIIVEGPMPERISIRNMKRLTDEELDQLYIQFGIMPPPVVDSLEELPADADEE
jgi:hypothetical protein